MEKNKNLKRIFEDQKFEVGPTKGTEVTTGTEVFNFINEGFKTFGLDKKSGATGKIPVAIYEIVGEATLNQMFNELYFVKQPILTMSQIILFCKSNSELFRPNSATFFFCKKEKVWWLKILEWICPELCSVYAVRVCSLAEGLYVFFHPIEYRHLWSSERHSHRVISPI